MPSELQTSLVCQTPTDADSNSDTDEDPGQSSSSPTHVASPQPAKKQTRQWAAWTRQEEESFFSALRQVGKNFEKITRRVQSKNKDQVRHYYYRLVRRMNKLLGPEFCLDAKNSKDTIAAMLRWWSLLEKYSCKASKLHLKPRRFKIFMDALEHQLLKDRKKNIKKRPTGESCCTAPSTVSNQSRISGNDSRAAKLILVESQNIQKSGPGKASSLKRNVNIGVNRNTSKGYSSTVKTTRQRRKPAGPVSSATYKRWEKAAVAGVSLVADAAEHLERTATDKEAEHDQGQTGFNPAANNLPPLPIFLQNPFAESNAQSCMKLKLQLFPINETTQRALEMDKHNPHLELTLSTRKKISSVLEHLNRKWGDSSVASGELMLFPYSVQKENLGSYQRWSQDSVVSAADVYAMLGIPAIFRLRYGWIPMTELCSATHQAPLATCSVSREHVMNLKIRQEHVVDSISTPTTLAGHQSENFVDSLKDKTSVIENTPRLQPSADVPDEIRYSGETFKDDPIISSDPSVNITWHSTMKQLEEDGLRLNHATAMSAGEWADTLTNISVGDLLPEASDKMDANCVDPPVAGSSLCHQPISFTCDSFDAAIAAHISRHQDRIGFQPVLVSYASSIWDAEETCDAFSFQKSLVTRQEVPDASRIAFSGSRDQISRMNSMKSGVLVEELPGVEGPADDPDDEDPMDECHSAPHTLDNAANDFGGVTDIYWPDSLGPLDLDIPSPRYHCNDLILSDSLSGLNVNRLIASSLDAFQNCSFFGVEKKETTSSVEARETTSFSDFKIGSGV